METRNKTLNKKKELYTTILGQSFSPCGGYLACCSHLGRVVIFNLTPTLSADATAEALHPYFSFSAPDRDHILCLSSKGVYMAGGSSDGKIYIWKWSDLIGKDSENVLTFHSPPTNSSSSLNLGSVEVNCISFLCEGPEDLKLYAGGGDGLVRSWDAGTGAYLQNFRGHRDSVLCLDAKSQKICSGSEDGSIKVWDARTGSSAIREIVPSDDRDCARTHLGSWIKCLATIPERDWMVCGGGPHLSLWHMDYSTSLCTFTTPDTLSNDVIIHGRTVVSGGNEPFVRHWSVNGREEACVPCTPTNVFSVVVSPEEATAKVLSIAGNCNKVDICSNFYYKSFSFQMV